MKKQYISPLAEMAAFQQEEPVSTTSNSYNDGEFSEW